MTIEQKQLIYLRCIEQNLISHSKKDTSKLCKRLLAEVKENIEKINTSIGIKEFEEVLNGTDKRRNY